MVRATEIQRVAHQTWTGSYDAAATQSGGVCGGTCNFTPQCGSRSTKADLGHVDQVYQAAMVAIALRPAAISGTMTMTR